MNLEMGSRKSRFVAELISLLELNGAIGVVREKCGDLRHTDRQDLSM